VWQISWHPANGANLERFLKGPFVKNGLLPNGRPQTISRRGCQEGGNFFINSKSKKMVIKLTIPTTKIFNLNSRKYI
jgi:hypothetical protein